MINLTQEETYGLVMKGNVGVTIAVTLSLQHTRSGAVFIHRRKPVSKVGTLMEN